MERADRATWAKRIERWKAGGLSAAEYAAEIGVNPSTLAYWKCRLGSEARRDRARKAAAGTARRQAKAAPGQSLVPLRQAPAAAIALSFIEVPREHVVAAVDPFEVVLANGLCVRVPPSFEPGPLVRLLEVVERRR